MQITPHGLVHDEQVDLRIHSGLEKAVHHYPWEHSADWRAELGPLALLNAPGALGENLSTTGLTENNMCWVDQVKIGTCLLAVSQTRQPCWKLNVRFGVPDMALRLQRIGHTGWYYRVLQPGARQTGDAVQVVIRPFPAWTLRHVLEFMYLHPLNLDEVRGSLQSPLSASWQQTRTRRLEREETEGWRARTQGT